MWNEGFFVLWRHVAQMYYQDVENCLKLLPRLTFDHINLNAYSKMRVNLAAQVLSASMAAICVLYTLDLVMKNRVAKQ